MAKDNNTGKDKEFYELGKKMFDRIPSATPRPSKIETQLKADIDLLWQVNSADIEALEDAKATLHILKKSAPIEFDDMIDETLTLIGKALSMNHGDSMERVADAAIRARGEQND